MSSQNKMPAKVDHNVIHVSKHSLKCNQTCASPTFVFRFRKTRPRYRNIITHQDIIFCFHSIALSKDDVQNKTANF